MFDFLEKWKKWAFWAVLGLGAALVFTTLVGGALFNLETSTVMGWFVTALLVLFVGMLVTALVAFLSWYLFTKPMVFIPLVAGVALLVYVIILIIKPDATPFVDLGEMLKPVFESLNL